MDDTPGSPSPADIARRRLLLGAGATALVAASLRGTETAEAKPSPQPKDWSRFLDASGPDPLAAQRSDPLSGYSYRGVSFADFQPVGEDNWRLLAATGFSSSAGIMMATLDIPAGAILRDVEWYYFNPGAGVELSAAVWRPGIFTLAKASVTNYPASSGPQVRRIVIPSTYQVAYSAGSKLILTFISNSAPQNAEIVGARAGFSGGGAVSLRDVPYRVYDSRNPAAGILPAGKTRTIAVPLAIAPPGSSGLVINLAAVGASANGYLRVYGAHAAAPTTSSINFGGQGAAIANGLLVGLSGNRLINVYASATVHFIVDVLGTLS